MIHCTLHLLVEKLFQKYPAPLDGSWLILVFWLFWVEWYSERFLEWVVHLEQEIQKVGYQGKEKIQGLWKGLGCQYPGWNWWRWKK